MRRVRWCRGELTRGISIGIRPSNGVMPAATPAGQESAVGRWTFAPGEPRSAPARGVEQGESRGDEGVRASA